MTLLVVLLNVENPKGLDQSTRLYRRNEDASVTNPMSQSQKSKHSSAHKPSIDDEVDDIEQLEHQPKGSHGANPGIPSSQK